MYRTSYLRAKNLDEAGRILADAEDGRLLAGGMTLLPTLKQRLAAAEQLIDLADCGLAGIAAEEGGLRIGAMTRHVDVANSELVQDTIPALAQLAGGIGDRQVRNRGTIGGSLANNDPSACYPSAVLGLGGTIQTNQRSIEAEDYFVDIFETALEEEEIITSVFLPKPDRAAYVKFPNPASRYAMAGVFLACFGERVRLAITGAGESGVFRHTGMEAALQDNFSAEAIIKGMVEPDALMEDIHASQEYRAHLVEEMARRAVRACS